MTPLRFGPRAILAIGAGFAPLACADGPDPDGSVQRDSAGIAIVESVIPLWGDGEGWTVDEAPILDLARTGDLPEHEFFGATDADRLSDGSIVVADDGSDELRFFSPEGAYIRTLGRDGDGPGEFRRLDQVIVLPGDSIFAYDFWQARITVFAPDGSLARIRTVDGAYRPRPLYPLSGGGFVGVSRDWDADHDEPGLLRSRSRIVRLGPEGAVVDTLTAVPGVESVHFSRGDGPALWGKSSHLAVHGDSLVVGAADSVEYQVRDPAGLLRRMVRVPGYDLTLSPEEIHAEQEAFRPDPEQANPVLLDMVREVMDLQPDRTHRPAYGAILVDPEGNVWLQEYLGRHESEEPRRWLIFDPSGRWLGQVMLPPRFEVFRTGSDWILGKRPDTLDVEHIQLLRLHRAGAGPTGRN